MIFVPIPNPSKAFLEFLNQVEFHNFLLMNPLLWEKPREEQEKAFEKAGKKLRVVSKHQVKMLKSKQESVNHVNCRSIIL